MRLAVSNQSTDSLRALIKERFGTLNRQSLPSRGRKYPQELRELVRQGASAGIAPVELSRLSGMSSTAVKGALEKKSRVVAAKRKVLPARRLEVVGVVAEPRRCPTGLVVRLPSGVSIELDGSGLTSTLLLTLARLEVAHASSR